MRGTLPSILLVIIGSAVVVYLKETIKVHFLATDLSMLMLGYGGHSVILRLLSGKQENKE